MQKFDPMVSRTDFFWYTPPAPLTIAPGATGTLNVQIDADSTFNWLLSDYQCSIAGALLTEATNVIPLITIYINDTGSGKYMMNAPVPITTLAGDGKRPYELPAPRLLKPNSTINFTFTSYAVAGSGNYLLYFVLGGWKDYGAGRN